MSKPMQWTSEKIRALRKPQATGWALYEQRKAEFQRQNPGAKPDEYARAMRQLANRLGV